MSKVLHIADEVIIRVGSGSNFRLVWNIPIFDGDVGNGAVGRQIICIGNNKIDNLSIIENEYKQLIQRLADTACQETNVTLSSRDNPRKFVTEIEEIFPEEIISHDDLRYS